MANPQKSVKHEAVQSEWPHAGVEDYAKMQKHQEELIEWLIQLDAEDAAQFFDKHHPFVR